jgi:hypothetical protein
MARMGNVLRVLGIVLASMLLGLVGLFLLLFTICGGLTSSDAGWILAVCLVVIAGCIALIVFLGRRISTNRATARGLAVPPAVDASDPSAAALYGTSPPQARPALPLRGLAGTDLQTLVALRVCLAILILLSVGSMIFTFVSIGRFGGYGGYGGYGSTMVLQLTLRSILGLLPPVALLVAVSVRNPPAGVALDAVAGFGIASILFRVGYLAFAGVLLEAFRTGQLALTMLPRLAGYSLLEAGVATLALYLRSRVGPISPVALIVATIAFLFWEGLVQAVMMALLSVSY